MISTTPAQERETRFSCPNPQGPCCHHPREGHIVQRAWTGQHQHRARRRCTICGGECCERPGTLRARSKLPAAPVAPRLQWQRWGVGAEGRAAIGAVALNTGHRLQRVAAQRAETPQWQSVQDVEVPGVQWDAAQAQLRPQQVEGVQTALAMGRWWLLGVDCGPRPQETAATLMAQVVARTRQRPLLLPDGWQARPRRGSRSWGWCIVPAGVGKGAARRHRAGWLRKPGPTPQWCSAATRLARWGMGAGGWGAVAHGVWSSRGGCGSSGRPARQPGWHAGRGRCGDGWRPGGAAPGV